MASLFSGVSRCGGAFHPRNQNRTDVLGGEGADTNRATPAGDTGGEYIVGGATSHWSGLLVSADRATCRGWGGGVTPPPAGARPQLVADATRSHFRPFKASMMSGCPQVPPHHQTRLSDAPEIHHDDLSTTPKTTMTSS